MFSLLYNFENKNKKMMEDDKTRHVLQIASLIEFAPNFLILYARMQVKPKLTWEMLNRILSGP